MPEAGVRPGHRVRRRPFLLALLVLSVFAAFQRGMLAVQNPDVRPAPASLEELEEAIQEILDQHHTPAAGVSLVSGDEVMWARGIGTADIASGRPADEHTLFRIGSISKMFVGLSVLQLQEKGQLDLNQTLKELAPEIGFHNPWEETDPVRLVHLLEHTAGFDDIHLREYAHNDPTPVTLRAGLDFNPKSRTSRWPPGRYFSYCNSGPAVAAYVVEKVSGMPFEEYVRVHLFDPLEMPNAGYLLSDSVQQTLASGYTQGSKTPAPYWHILMRPSGSINASPLELANLVRMLLNRGEFHEVPVLSAESILRMETPQTTLAAERGVRTGYGLGNFTRSIRGFLFHGHDGGVNAYLSSLGYLPREGRGYVLMINSDSGAALRELQEVVAGYLVKDLEPPRGVFEQVPPERLLPLARYYEPITPRQEVTRFLDRLLGVIRIDFRQSTLQVSRLFDETSETLIPVTDRRFRGEEEPLASVAFVPLDAGEIILQGSGKVIGGNYQAVSGAWIWLQRIAVIVTVSLMLSSVLFALAWLPKRLFSGRPISCLRIRLIPLLAVLSSLGAFAVIVWNVTTGTEQFLFNMGTMTVWSFSFWAFTWLLAGFSILGAAVLLASLRCPVSTAVLVHSSLVSIANLALTAYLWFWGIIGLQSWA